MGSNRESMLGLCANETCRRPLHSLANGRLFQFEVISISLSASDEAAAPFDERPQREMVHFWLCGNCASAFILVLEPARGLKLVPLEHAEQALRGRLRGSVEGAETGRC